MLAVIAIQSPIVRDIFTKPHQLFMREGALRLDIPLQALPLFELLEDQRVLFGPIALPGFQRLGFILRPDLGVLPGQTVPDTGKAFRQTLCTLSGFSLPAFFMGGPKLLPFVLVTGNQFRFAEGGYGDALLCIALDILDEGFELVGHALRDPGPGLIDRAQRFRIAEACFQVFGFHPGIAGERIDLAAIIDSDKPAPVAFGEPETAFLERLFE